MDRKKRTRKKKKVTVRALSRRVTKIERSRELKAIDTAAPLVITNTPVFQLLNGCVQGDAYGQREGTQIQMTKLSLRYIINQNGATSPTHVRVILVIDRQTNGAPIASGDFFKGPGPTFTTLEYYNLTEAGRFKVLYDRVHRNDPNNGPNNTYHSTHHRLNSKVFYDGNLGSVVDINKNSLFLIAYADMPTAGVYPSLRIDTRVRFLDS